MNSEIVVINRKYPKDSNDLSSLSKILPTLQLPLAQSADASPDGFWVKAGENTANCKENVESNINKIFSGNPCILGGGSVSTSSPIYAWQPSDKRYHFYNSEEIATCFEERGLNKILIQGDSQARTLFSTLPFLIGDVDLGPNYAEELKEQMKQKVEGVNGNKVGNLGRRNIEVIYKQEWGEDYTFADELFKQAGLFTAGGPEVFIYNAGAPAHKTIDPIGFVKWWKSR